MENHLYLLEMFVEVITFSANLPEYPLSSDIVVLGEMGKFVTLTIQPVENLAEPNQPRKEITMNSGQSCLFASTPDHLFDVINANPFRISLQIKNRQVANADLGWTKDFYALVKSTDSNEYIKMTADMKDQLLLKETGTDRIMADVIVTVKLSSFGDRLHTTFQAISTEDTKKYLVKGTRCNTAFECKKVTNGIGSSSVLPLTPLLASTSKDFIKHSEFHIEDEGVSVMALFKSNLDPRLSILPEEFNITISNITNANGKTPSAMTFDIISLREKPEENKYIDLRIRGGSQGFIFEFEPHFFNSPYEMEKQDLGDTMVQTIDEEDALTVEKINKMLCNNKDCPAAKKFKEFGIGPLANTQGLGCVQGEPSLPVTYGISQTYGVFDEYGPYGLFSRPKRPSNPFIPKQETDWASSCWMPKRHKKEKNRESCCKCQKYSSNACYCRPQESPLRLNGGCCYRSKYIPGDSEKTCETEECSPLRLTGGGVLDYDDVKSPFHECKEIMDQFDEVLRKYKKALGPCGKATCPFAPNVTKESCKKMCPGDMQAYSVDQVYVPPQREQELLEECKATPKKSFPPKGACGSPKCAYAKYKHGLTDEDIEMELQYLPSAPSGKCGHPKCPYPVEPDLPPIHWDCPDPLPKGRCKNPECPYLPKEIKCLNAVLAKGPCGNFNCPFSPPSPCSSPNCPFASKECPYAPENTGDIDSICDNPECPFAPKEENSLCDNSECPFAKKDSCPKQTKACPKPPLCYPPSCPTPACPMNPYLQSILAYISLLTGNTNLLKPCYGGPECPLTAKAPGSDDICSNSECPFQKPTSTKKNVCNKPDPNVCIQKPSPCFIPEESICGNPNCPFVQKPNDAVCHSKKPNDDVCDFKPYKNKENSEDDICTNTDCPYSPKTCYIKPPPCYEPKNDDICENPECPYQSTPPCPTMNPPLCFNPLQALLSYCIPLSVCPEGVCPYQFQDALPICFGGPECPYTKLPQIQPCKVEEKSVKETEICKNPDCPHAQKGQGDKTRDNMSLPEGIEYTSGTRTDIDNAPCTKETCKREGGGDLVCEDCTCGGPGSGDVEYRSDTRISYDLAPCTKKTCQSAGGKLICDVCPCTKHTKSAPVIGEKKKKRRKRSKGKYVYSVGDKYPGVQIGHKECVMPGFNVPRKMGWLWNIHIPCMQLKPRRGWRPGAVGRTIAERIRKHRESQGLPMLELKDLRKGKKKYGFYDSGTSINVQPKPTLHIKKHDGCYWITMNPLKDPNTLVENENPYMECSPLQFKIVKNKKQNEEKEKSEYKSCFCGDEENEAESSSDSELEIEFTPPAGIIHPERFKKKRNVVHCDTQYLPADFEVKSEKSSKKDKKEKKGKKDKGKGKKKGGKKGKK